MIRQILSFADDAEKAAPFIKTLLPIAERVGAHTQIGVLTAAPMLIPQLAPLGTLFVPEPVFSADAEKEIERLRALTAGAGKAVDVWGVHDGVRWLAADIRDTWHLADLIVIGPPETWLTPWLRRRLVETLLVAAGTPIVLLPDDRSLPPIRRAVLGWKPSAESSRVLHDLVALAEPGAHIDVATVGPEPQNLPGDELPGSGVEAYLTRHGFKVEMHRFDDGGSAADQLRAFALSRRADILAIGGFAHSRVREIILGGVTRSAIDEPWIPILMAH